MNFSDIGMTKEEFQNRLIENMTAKLLESRDWEADDSEKNGATIYARSCNVVKEKIDNQIAAITEKYVIPKLDDFITEMQLQQTTEWGETRGNPLSLKQYLVQQASVYFHERVDDYGRTSTCGKSRLDRLVQKYTEDLTKDIIKNTLDATYNSIAKDVAESAKAAIINSAAKLKVEVK